MELRLHRILRLYCLVDHSRNWFIVQRSRAQKVSADTAVSVTHDCRSVCTCPLSNILLSVLMHDFVIEPPSSGFFGDIHWPIPAMQVLSLEH